MKKNVNQLASNFTKSFNSENSLRSNTSTTHRFIYKEILLLTWVDVITKSSDDNSKLVLEEKLRLHSSNHASITHSFRQNEVLFLTGNDVIAKKTARGATGEF